MPRLKRSRTDEQLPATVPMVTSNHVTSLFAILDAPSRHNSRFRAQHYNDALARNLNIRKIKGMVANCTQLFNIVYDSHSDI